MSHSLPKCDYWKCPWHSSRFLQWDLLLLQRLQNICCFHLLPGTRTSQTISAVKSGNACSFWMYWKLICTIKNWTVTESNWTYKIGNLEIMFYDWYFILKMWFYCLLVCRCLLANTKLFSCRKIVCHQLHRADYLWRYSPWVPPLFGTADPCLPFPDAHF